MIDQFPWAMHFTNIDVNKKKDLFNKNIKNIIRNYIPHETITCDDRGASKDINPPFKSYCQNKKDIFSVHQFKLVQSMVKSLIEKSKSNYYYACLSKKLSDPTTSLKSYWSILKAFLNDKKIPCISPLLHNDKFITSFKQTVEIFNRFFANHYSLTNTNSDLFSVLP